MEEITPEMLEQFRIRVTATEEKLNILLQRDNIAAMRLVPVFEELLNDDAVFQRYVDVLSSLMMKNLTDPVTVFSIAFALGREPKIEYEKPK